MNRINRSQRILGIFYIVLFGFIFLCNALTLKVADDYNYCFSWADKSRIASVMDIFPSMVAHAQTMNGRLFAHATAQFFLMQPDWMFDLVNSLVFVIQIPLIIRLCKCEERNNLLHAGVFCAIWVCVPVFGQVNLWLDGACNYLWNVAIGLLFIQPYVNYFLSEESRCFKISDLLFACVAFLMGGWGESGSAAFIFMAAMLTILCRFYQHKKIPPVFVVGLLLAIMGYLSMYLAPAQAGKGGELSLLSFCKGLFRCLQRLGDIWLLVVAFAVLFFFNIRSGTDKERLILSAVLFLGAMCANFILVFAVTYPERVAISATILIIAADAVLMQGMVKKGNYRTAAITLLAVLVMTAPARITWGTYDILRTYLATKANEQYLLECAENGVKDVVLPMVYAETDYSAVSGLRYLSTEDPSTWPNNAMAKYYGVESILGE